VDGMHDRGDFSAKAYIGFFSAVKPDLYIWLFFFRGGRKP